MVDINWGILRPVDIGGAFNQGVEMGRQRRAESEIDKQLAAMAQDPNAPISNELMKFAPREAYQFRQAQDKRQKELEQQALRVRAYGGDRDAIKQVFGFDPELVMKLDENSKKQIGEAVKFTGQAALQVDSLPEEQRAAAWAQYVQIAEQRGMDIPPQYETYSPQALQAVIAESGMIDKLISQRVPDYMAPVDGAPLINVKDPAAVAQWNSGGQAPVAAPTSKEDYDALPPGSQYTAPDGTTRIKGGGQAATPPANFPGWY